MMSRLSTAAAGIAVGFLCASLLGTAPARDLEQEVGLRWLFKLRGPVAPPDQVVMVVMNQKTATNISLPRDPEKFHRCEDLSVGAVPANHVSLPTIPSRWPRCLHAQLIDRLSAAGASTIVFDVLFRERPPLPGISGDLHAWQDDQLASAIASARRVVIAQKVETVDGHEILAELSPVVESAALGSAPLPLIAEAGGRVDRFMAFKETGLVVPTLPVIAVQAYALSAYPMLADLLARTTDDAAALLPKTGEAVAASGHLEATSLLIRQLFRNDRSLAQRVRDEMHRRGALSLDATSSARLEALVSMYAGSDTRLLNLYGPAGTLRVIDYDQALTASPEALSALFKGRTVFVGFAETAQHEQVEHFATAFSSGDSADLSGVEIAATAFSNLLDDRTIRALPFPYWLVVTFLAGVLSLVVCARLRNRVALAAMAVAAGLYGGAALYLFANYQVWMPTVVPMLIAVPAGMLLAFAWKYWNAHRQREHLRHAFSYFVPREVVTMLERNAGQIGTSQESIECACVATDAANFTPLAETMTPEKLTGFLNQYFEALFGRVAEHGGFVSDVVGDAMLAIWPHRSADTHLQLLHAVLEMHDAARQFNERLAGNRLMTRFGVEWGRVALTTVGAHGHYEYRAVGDAVNTATRIQELNKKLGTSILVSQPAIGDVGNEFLLRDLGRFLLRGKTQSVHLYELLATRATAKSEQSDLCARFANAIHAFTGGQQAAAVSHLQNIHRAYPTDGPTAFFLRSLESGVKTHDGALVVD